MVLNVFTSGINTSFSTELNENTNIFVRDIMLTRMRSDRVSDASKSGGFSTNCVVDSLDSSSKSSSTSLNFWDSHSGVGNVYYIDDGSSGVLEMNTGESFASYNKDTLTKGFFYADTYVCKAIDTFSDSSVDTSLWVSDKTMTETSGYLGISTSSNGNYLRNKTDYYESGKEIHALVYSDTGLNSTSKIQITDDGTNTINLGYLGTYNEGVRKFYYIIKFLSASDEADVWVDFMYLGRYDLSSLSAASTRYIQLAEAGNGNSDLRFYTYGEAGTTTSSFTNYLSLDGGDSYTSVSSEVFSSITNTGNNPSAKLGITRSSGEIVFIRGYGGYFI